MELNSLKLLVAEEMKVWEASYHNEAFKKQLLEVKRVKILCATNTTNLNQTAIVYASIFGLFT